MKRYLFVIGALLVAAAGCDKEPCAVCGEELTQHHVCLELTGSALQTKALDVPSLSESNVVRCRLYVFSRGGELVGDYDSLDGRFDFFLTDETYDFVAVVNKGGLPGGTVTRETLLATVTRLSENAVGCFVMAGWLDSHLIESDEKITVEVHRLVGKVSYKVRTAFPGALAEEPFVIEDIYLTNVAGSCSLAPSSPVPEADALWYNRMDLETGEGTDAVSDLLAGHIGLPLKAVDSIATGHSFYPFPNASPDNHDRERWTGRCTRFVVRATLAGRTTYYPVTLPEVRSNHHYHIDLTISNYGVEHPEDPLGDYTGVTPVLTVDSWDEGGSLQGEF
ncbi:MAG: FimB/Mfa2 family fimbrial subunit [Bacteroidales bacterium]|nr:FimB/Mfa2 family fimbrial subunit [Bacteroidales bacterium]